MAGVVVLCMPLVSGCGANWDMNLSGLNLIPDNFTFISQPVVADGVVYFTSPDGHLYAVNAGTGKEIWKFKAGGPIFASPVVADGVAYFGDMKGDFYAVNLKTRKQKWKVDNKTAVFGAAVVDKGLVFFGSSGIEIELVDDNKAEKKPGKDKKSSNGAFYALETSSGREKWKIETDGIITFRPTIAGGYVYFSELMGNLHAVKIKTGREKWNTKGSSPAWTAPIIVGDVVCFGTIGVCEPPDFRAGQEKQKTMGTLFLRDIKTGREKWKLKVPGLCTYSFAASGGVLYFSSADGHVYGVDVKKRKIAWKFETEGKVMRAGAVADGVIYFATEAGTLYAVDIKTVRKKWSFKAPGKVYSRPTVAGGVVYFGCDDLHLYAVDARTGKEKWKFKIKEPTTRPATGGKKKGAPASRPKKSGVPKDG